MKRRFVLICLIIIFSCCTACSNKSNKLEADITSKSNDSAFQVKKQITELNFDFSKTTPYSLFKGLWCNENSLLLAFHTKPGEAESIKLLSWSLDTGEPVLVYRNSFEVDNTDQMMMNGDAIGYQNYDKAIIIDANTLKLKQEIKAKAGTTMCYSPNMEYLAETSDGGLYITETKNAKKTLLDKSVTDYLYLSWSSNNSKLLYMDSSYSKISIIDIKTGNKQTLRAGEDFKVPDGWVDITACRFLPKSSDILINILCENQEAMAVLSQADGYQSKIVSTSNSVKFMDASPGSILYLLDDKSENKLIRWDYVHDSKDSVYQSQAIIDCAFFSPDGSKIMFCTRDKQKQHLYVYK